MELFRGDTFGFDFNATLEDDSTHDFCVGDTLKVGIKDKLTNSKYVALKEIKITENTDTIYIEFTKEETKKWSQGEKLLEVELTDTKGKVTTLYQDKLTVKGDVIR